VEDGHAVGRQLLDGVLREVQDSQLRQALQKLELVEARRDFVSSQVELLQLSAKLEVFEGVDPVDSETSDFQVGHVANYRDVADLVAPEINPGNLLERLLGLHLKGFRSEFDASLGDQGRWLLLHFK